MAKDLDTKQLQEQAEAILERAKQRGVANNFFFATTFARYQTQLEILKGLEAAIMSEGTMVEKEYVKGRRNLYTNPAIQEYNRTSTAANGTVITLIKIIEGFGDDSQNGTKLGKFMREMEE